MNRIILIGNGFDLAHGMETSYANFIDWFWKEEFNELINKWSNSKKSVSSRDEKTKFVYENEIFVLEADDHLNKQLDAVKMKAAIVQYKNKFLEKIEQSRKIVNWVDIEELYFKQLVDCKDRLRKDNYTNYTVKQLNKDFRFLKVKLKDYLKKEDEKRSKIIESETKLQEDLKNIIFKDDKDDSNLLDGKILLLNFNFTNTNELYKKHTINGKEKKIHDCIHIHGNIVDGIDSMIFGYGDEMSKDSEELENLNDNDFLENVKSIKYVESFEYQKLLKFIKEDTDEKGYDIFVLGHSCGNSDRTLLNTLFQDDKCKHIKCFYYEKYDGSDNFKELATNIYRNFKLEEKGNYRNKLCDKKKCSSHPQKSGNNREEHLENISSNMHKFADCEFTMGDGSDSDNPPHQVKLSKFWIGKYQVTQEEWQNIMDDNLSRFKENKLPVENVSWYDAVLFCNRLSEKHELGKYYDINGEKVTLNERANGFRLPTEAEWEYAAMYCRKDGKKTKYAGCDNESELENYGWYNKNSDEKTHEVGTAKNTNELNIHDMSGNVWEWCYDWYGDYGSNPQGAASGSARVCRGGSWYIVASYCRVSFRSNNTPDYRYGYLGFRLARSL